MYVLVKAPVQVYYGKNCIRGQGFLQGRWGSIHPPPIKFCACGASYAPTKLRIAILTPFGPNPERNPGGHVERAKSARVPLDTLLVQYFLECTSVTSVLLLTRNALPCGQNHNSVFSQSAPI